MEARNAFIGKSEKPSPEELSAALGPTAILWNEFVAWMASELGVVTQEWKGVYPNKYGWSLRLKMKTRNIVYLSPYAGILYGRIHPQRPGSEGGQGGSFLHNGSQGNRRRTALP